MPGSATKARSREQSRVPSAVIFGLAAAGMVLLLAASGGGASNKGTPADWVSVVKIVVGVLPLLLAKATSSRCI